MMELRNATKTYDQGRRNVQAVRGVSLRIGPGEYVSIMGPSGSGKSLSDGERSLLRRTRIGFVFQFFNLLPTLTGGENVALPLLLGGVRRGDARKRAEASLDRVGLHDRTDHFPEEMSGGEMQRVAIARALVSDPDAILCDEPTGNLDSVTSQDILSLLRGLPAAGRCSVVMVTHDPQAASFGDRVVHIRDGLVERDEESLPALSQVATRGLS